jgi:hypothetical protein
LTLFTYKVQCLLGPITDMAASDHGDLLAGSLLTLRAHEQLLGGLLLLGVDVIRYRHLGVWMNVMCVIVNEGE